MHLEYVNRSKCYEKESMAHNQLLLWKGPIYFQLRFEADQTQEMYHRLDSFGQACIMNYFMTDFSVIKDLDKTKKPKRYMVKEKFTDDIYSMKVYNKDALQFSGFPLVSSI